MTYRDGTIDRPPILLFEHFELSFVFVLIFIKKLICRHTSHFIPRVLKWKVVGENTNKIDSLFPCLKAVAFVHPPEREDSVIWPCAAVSDQCQEMTVVVRQSYTAFIFKLSDVFFLKHGVEQKAMTFRSKCDHIRATQTCECNSHVCSVKIDRV